MKMNVHSIVVMNVFDTAIEALFEGIYGDLVQSILCVSAMHWPAIHSLSKPAALSPVCLKQL
jgi:hypothetical protein